MIFMAVVAAALIVLVVGDFASTFFYHVPQHLWFTLHLRTHHDRKRSYWDHAVLSADPSILLDGFLGAEPDPKPAREVPEQTGPDLFQLAAEELGSQTRGLGDLTVVVTGARVDDDDEFLILASYVKAPHAWWPVGADNLLGACRSTRRAG